MKSGKNLVSFLHRKKSEYATHIASAEGNPYLFKEKQEERKAAAYRLSLFYSKTKPNWMAKKHS